MNFAVDWMLTNGNKFVTSLNLYVYSILKTCLVVSRPNVDFYIA